MILGENLSFFFVFFLNKGLQVTGGQQAKAKIAEFQKICTKCGNIWQMTTTSRVLFRPQNTKEWSGMTLR